MRKIFYSFLFVALLAASAFYVTPVMAAGATLSLSPSSGTPALNGKFTVAVKISTGGQSINAGQGTISFDKTLLKVTGVSKGSVFSLWTVEPAFSNGSGTVEFGGGVPRPGYTGNGGTIAVITFQAIKAGTAAVKFTSGDVLANDGKGTNILSGMGSASFVIAGKVEAPKPTTPPENKVPTTPAPTPVTKPTPAPQETAAFNRPEISSETHADQTKWYQSKTAKFSWKLPDGATGVSVIFDQSANTAPGSLSDGLFNSKEYVADRDGSWYVHVKVKDEKGRWGTPGHFRVNVDSTPPKDFVPTIQQDDLNDWPIINFQATDELSAIDHYELLIDSLSATPIILTSDKTSYKFENLEVGKHTVAVKAVDKANNATIASITFDVNSVATPVITNYTPEINPNDKLFISGTANPKNDINIYIQGAAGPEMTTVKSDNDGNWFLASEKKFANGRYTAWVEAINPNGLKSKQSAKISFLVSPPVFVKIGSFVINYFTVLVSLVFVVVLIVALLIWIFEFVRKRLKKETIEIEDVLAQNIEELKWAVSQEVDDMGKMSKVEFTKSRTAVKNRLCERIDDTNKKILKEVKDVERILK